MGARKCSSRYTSFLSFPDSSESCADRQIAQSAPLAAKIAFVSAGAAVGRPISPQPDRIALADRRSRTSTSRGVGDAQQRIVVEVALHDLTVLDGDLEVERRGEAVDRAALHLRCDAERLIGRPTSTAHTHALECDSCRRERHCTSIACAA